MTEARYIAMWSGPRNISTAMMRSWENRPDTYVHDEPFYAHYLTQTDYNHPGKEEVIAAYENDWQAVVEMLTGEIPEGKTIYYQKHMTHHMLPHMSLDWIGSVTNCFLIREPRAMLASFMRVFPNPTLEQTGLPAQIMLFDKVKELTGEIPPVLDSRDVLKNPRDILSKLCDAIDVPFYENMLLWRAGKRDTDGNWAKYWYASVEESTGFMPYQPKDITLPDHVQDVLAECEAIYEQMYEHRLQ